MKSDVHRQSAKAGETGMITFWILILILTAVLWYVLTHFFGTKTYNYAEKIYNDLNEEETMKGGSNDV